MCIRDSFSDLPHVGIEDLAVIGSMARLEGKSDFTCGY